MAITSDWQDSSQWQFVIYEIIQETVSGKPIKTQVQCKSTNNKMQQWAKYKYCMDTHNYFHCYVYEIIIIIIILLLSFSIIETFSKKGTQVQHKLITIK